MDNSIAGLGNALEEEDYEVTSKILKTLDRVHLADFLVTTKTEIRNLFIRNHLKDYPDVLAYFTSDLLFYALEELGVRKFAEIIQKLPADDIVDILEDLEADYVKEILDLFPHDLKNVTKEILAYPEESAGRLIHKDFIVVPKNWSIEQVLQFIRIQKRLPKYLNEIFVVDENTRPIGSITLNGILCAKSRSTVETIMETDIKIVKTGQAQEEVAKLFQDYSLNSAPVIDSTEKIVGIISLDDVLEVIKEAAEEDLLHVGRLSESDLNANVFTTVFRRIKWLIITFISINFSSYIIGFFESTLSQSVELAMLMPVVAAMGGNAGIQASTVAVRAILAKHITGINIFRIFVKEFTVGLCNGLIMSALMIIIIFLRFHASENSIQLEATFTFSIIIVFTLATSVGSAIPFIVEKFGGDPTLSSSVITSSFTDILTFVILLSVATFILI